MSLLKNIPSVEKVLQALRTRHALPHASVVKVVRTTLEELRQQVLAEKKSPLEEETIIKKIDQRLAQIHAAKIQPVINGTGVLIHTNLGRSPLGQKIAQRLFENATQYTNLEFDLLSGKRGNRGEFLEQHLALLCETEAATLVNNCASALILLLKYFITEEKREVIISRSELVEIGGGFRIPEILEASGAQLKEVGATNKTTLADYEKAIGPHTALILKVHRSNFYIEGFTDFPPPEKIAQLAKANHIPFVEDLGSGCLMATDQLAPIEHEPTPIESLHKGIDLVCFSGDKLLGGPQAGVIAGKRELIQGIKREPFFRAVRCDKLILTVMQETVLEYLALKTGETKHLATSDYEIPVLRMLKTPVEDLQKRAETISSAVKKTAPPFQLSLGKGMARLGGGTMPKSSIPSVTIDILPDTLSLETVAEKLRYHTPPVIGYLEEEAFHIDLRTVFPHQDELLIDALTTTLRECL